MSNWSLIKATIIINLKDCSIGYDIYRPGWIFYILVEVLDAGVVTCTVRLKPFLYDIY